MIREPGAGGTVSLVRTETSGWAGGTVSDDVQNQPDAADGTLTFSRAEFMAFITRTRWGAAVVTLNDEVLSTVIGDVKVTDSLGSPSPSASFTVSDPRACMADTASLTWGEQTVLIDFSSGRPGAMETVRWFEGITENNPASGAYRAHATLSCTGKAAINMALTGCLIIPAFSGLKTGAILSLYAAACGVTLLNAAAIANMGKPLVKRIEINGLSVWDVAVKIGELIGGFPLARVDGSLEMLLWSELLSTPPIIDLGTAYYLPTPSEQPPSKPTTKWTLSCEAVVDFPAGFVTVETPSGDTITRVTTDRGVEVMTEVDEYATFAAGGVTSGPLMYQLSRRTRTVSNWTQMMFPDGKTHFTTELASRVISVWEWFSPPCEVGAGYTWDDLSQHRDVAATFQITQKTTTTNTWSGVWGGLITSEQWGTNMFEPCSLVLTLIDTQSYYSPVVAPGAPGYTYSDGSLRADPYWTWRSVSSEFSQWRSIFAVFTAKYTRYGGYVTGTFSGGTGPCEQAIIYAQDVEKWTDVLGGTKYSHVITRQNETKVGLFTITLPQGTPPVQILVDEVMDGFVPRPPNGSAEAGQYATQTIIAPFVPPTTLPFRVVPATETLEFAQDLEDLQTVQGWRLRNALADRVTIPARLIPFVSCGDVVSCTVPSLQLAAAVGIVESVDATQGISTGRGRCTTIVRLVQ